MTLTTTLTAADIFAVIERNGWSDVEAAEHLGVSLRNICRWRAGRYKPSPATFEKIAFRFGHHPDEFWGPEWGIVVEEPDVA